MLYAPLNVGDHEKKQAMLIAGGDRQAFEEFFNHHHKGLYLLALRYFKDRALAEDVVQDIFCKVWMNRASVDPEQSVKGFLYTTAKNHILNVLRNNERVARKILDYIRRNQADAAADISVPVTELSDKIYEAIDSLPKKRRIIVKLKLYKGLDNKKIAGKLKISVNTVKFQYSYALKQIRNMTVLIAGYWLLITGGL